MLKLTYSNLEFQIFPGKTPDPPSSRGGKGKGGEEREGKRKGRREGKDREGRDGKGQGREGGGKGGMGVVGRGGEGRGARHGLRSLPPRDKLWIRPWLVLQLTFRVTTAGLCYS